MEIHLSPSSLPYFLQNEWVTSTNVERLCNFMSSYKPSDCKKIINAQLPNFSMRTSVHLAAGTGKTRFLQILLENRGNTFKNNQIISKDTCYCADYLFLKPT